MSARDGPSSSNYGSTSGDSNLVLVPAQSFHDFLDCVLVHDKEISRDAAVSFIYSLAAAGVSSPLSSFSDI